MANKIMSFRNMYNVYKHRIEPKRLGHANLLMDISHKQTSNMFWVRHLKRYCFYGHFQLSKVIITCGHIYYSG